MRRAWRCPESSPLCWRRVSSQTARSRFRPPWCPISEPTVWFPPVADRDVRRRAGPGAVVVLALLLGGITVGYTWVVAGHLGDDARDTSRLRGRVFAGLNAPRPDAATDALLDLAAHVRGLGIPIAITDTAGRGTGRGKAPPQNRGARPPGGGGRPGTPPRPGGGPPAPPPGGPPR